MVLHQRSSLLLVAVTIVVMLSFGAQGQQDLTAAQVPNPFRVGDFYPPQSEVEVCRPIRDYIDRNSARFTNELVTNSNPDIIFNTANSRIMSSRMQSRLNSLASAYRTDTGKRMTVLRAWTQFPNSQLNTMSLHYEGRSVQVRLPSGSNYDDFLQLAVEAAIDWVAYNSTTLVTLSVIPTNCERSVDCVFVLDRSGSVGRNNHNTAIQFIQTFVSFFNIGLNQTRVGFVAYSSNPEREFDLNDYTTLDSLTTRIGEVRYTGGGTRTGRALDWAGDILDPTMNFGARVNEAGVPKIVILITDGRSHDNVVTPSDDLKREGVIVYALGIGNIDRSELRDISSDPDSDHTFVLSSYRDAAGIVSFLSVTTCETPAIINPDGNVTTTIPPGGLEYFQTECPAYTDTVLIELTDLNGTNFLYASATEDNPGPLTEDTIRNETAGIRRRTLTLSIPSRSNVVYIGVQGQTQQNTFNIIVWDQLFNPSDVIVDKIEGGTGRQLIYDVSANLLSRAPASSLRYSIIEGNSAGFFTINSQGRVHITNAQVLDANQQEFHNLTVLAQHTNEACQRARTRISVRVLSNRINFGQVNTRTVSENAAVGTQVTRITASGGRGPIQFSITGGNVGNRFMIGQSTGVITVQTMLNYETTQTFTLTVRAQTNENGVVTRTINQIINVEDINEAPSFVTDCAQAGRCSFSTIEGRPLNTYIDVIQAQDPDLPNVANGMLAYSLQPSTSPFSVNASGHITTRQSLDRETRDSYTMTLFVTDGMERIQTSVIIAVNDTNDNAPVFTQAPTTLEVEENAAIGLEVAQYIAQDSDIGSNAAIEYVLLSSSNNLPFSINSQSGVLTVSRNAIDYEEVQSYNVNVTARNPSNHSSAVSQTATINVINLNDDRPRFIGTPYVQSVAENTPVGHIVATVFANDSDLGSFGVVRYSINSGNFQESFTINSTSGALKTNKVINREIVSSFSLVVEARDGGGRTSTTRVEITITDINDNSPMFVNTPYQAQVREDVGVPFDVIQVTARDDDEPGNPNSQITYNITAGNDGGTFTINGNTGQISIAQTLDFETIMSYSLTVRASDGGTPSNTAEETVMITVINVNEDPPRISGDQSVNISESASVGSILARFTALDLDSNKVTFSIISGNSDNIFSIEASSGRVTLANNLDYETRSAYVLVIDASDGAGSTNSTLTVTVLDENEFAPVFSGGTAFSVDEEEPANTFVGTIMATDADGDPANNQVTYSFVQQTSHFTIGSTTGEIRTVGVLNREMLTQVFVPPASQLRLDVTARDSASPSRQNTTSITITLEDINDNSPVFADSMYNSSLLENLPANQIVFLVSASDPDLRLNGEIVYSFELNRNVEDTSYFTIIADNGTVMTTRALDCERQTNYSFTITATDRGNSARSSTVQGILNVIDENDNAPIFSQNPYTISLFENSQIDREILRVNATDADKGMNGQFRFSVENQGGFLTSIEGQGDEFVIFAVDPITGSLSHRTNFNYENARQVNVTVLAADLGIPRRRSSATVIINVMNVDETPPTFTVCPREVFVVENSISTLTRCIAEDPDNVTTSSNSQSAIAYSISDGNEQGLFGIDATTGTISIVGSLDRENQQSYELTIRATDLAGFTTSTDIIIGVLDVNDNRPQFGQTSYTYDFTEAQIQNYVQDIIRLSASDNDNSENGTVKYSISNVSKGDRQTVITVNAMDSGSVPQSSNVSLTVNFQDSCLLQEYTINEDSGQVTAHVLCRIAIQQESLNVSLGSSGSKLTCSILHNSQMSYQWVHNGSLITLPTLFPARNRLPVDYTFTNTRFEQAGAYACKATTQAGSLQTSSSSVKIWVAPVIVVHPEDALVVQGGTATFRCVGSGIPPPKVEWYDESGTLLAEGNTLTRQNVQTTRRPRFVCTVSSDSGRDQATASLTVYTSNEAVKISITGVVNQLPSVGGFCNFINKTQIEAIVVAATKMSTTVTSIEGGNVCELSPCLPNPCMNGGVCSISDVENGYVCACRSGYIGENCTQDRDECANDPCFDGTCVNNDGGFECQCNNDSTGHLCQYSTSCLISSQCTDDTVCVPTLDQSYICRNPPRQNETVVITGSMNERQLGILSDLVQTEVDKYLAARATANSRRRRRQVSSVTTLATSCEPRFIQPDSQENLYALIWICPVNVTEPTPEDQVVLCNALLESSLVVTCKPPNAQELSLPKAPSPMRANVTITIVLTDGSGKPLDAAEAQKAINENGVSEQLQQASGLQITGTSVTSGNSGSSSPDNIGMIVGIVVGCVLLIVLVAALVVGIVMFVRRKRDVEERKQLDRRLAIQMLEKQETASSSDDADHGQQPALDSVFTSSVDNLLYEKSTYSEGHIDILNSANKAEENPYDILPPKNSEGI